MRLIDADTLNFEGQRYSKMQLKAILDFVDAQPTVVETEFATDINAGSKGWIPCSERLPEKCGAYLVSYKNTNCIPCATVFDGVQFLDKHVIAWMPLPEPWRGESNAKEE